MKLGVLGIVFLGCLGGLLSSCSECLLFDNGLFKFSCILAFTAAVGRISLTKINLNVQTVIY